MRSRKNDFDDQELEFVSQVQLPDCPQLSELHAAREGVLPEDRAGVIRTHVEQCAICHTLFEDLESMEFGTPTAAESANIRERITRSAPKAFAPRKSSPAGIRNRWWVPALAMAACAVVAVVLFNSPKKGAPAAGPEIAQVKPIPEVALEKLAIRVNPTALLATRGAGNASQPTGRELVKALGRYQKDDYAGAVQQLRALAKKYPQDGVVSLYLGVSELFLDQNQDAAQILANARVLNEGARRADSEWYLAVAGLRLRKPETALPLLHELCEGKTSYSERACAIESQLK